VTTAERLREIIHGQYFGTYSSCRTTTLGIVIAQVKGLNVSCAVVGMIKRTNVKEGELHAT
jgi:hypothetical protein